MPNRNYYQANKEKLKEQAKIRYCNKSIIIHIMIDYYTIIKKSSEIYLVPL